MASMSKDYFAYGHIRCFFTCRIRLGAWPLLVYIARNTIATIAVTRARFIAMI